MTLGGALSALILYYFLYEYLHYCMHIPKGRWLEKTFWFKWLDSHHHMHHKRHFNNLNVVLPVADMLFGTLIPGKEHLATPNREAGARQQYAELQGWGLGLRPAQPPAHYQGARGAGSKAELTAIETIGHVGLPKFDSLDGASESRARWQPAGRQCA